MKRSWVQIPLRASVNQYYPVLVLSAHRGSGKTAAAEIIKGLIDPGKAALVKLH
jgi:ABC-type molybdate transport system ATPase subunit